jgi:hypothetical protein
MEELFVSAKTFKYLTTIDGKEASQKNFFSFDYWVFTDAETFHPTSN